MSRIRSRGNKTTEKRMRAFLVRLGVSGWKLHPPGILGSPDFVFPDARVIVFVDGCFWHACPTCGHSPSSNQEYWNPKLRKNVERDLKYTKELREAGWKVLRVWEHEIKDEPKSVVERVIGLLLPNDRNP